MVKVVFYHSFCSPTFSALPLTFAHVEYLLFFAVVEFVAQVWPCRQNLNLRFYFAVVAISFLISPGADAGVVSQTRRLMLSLLVEVLDLV